MLKNQKRRKVITQLIYVYIIGCRNDITAVYVVYKHKPLGKFET